MQLFRNINAKELAALLTLVACFAFTGFAMVVEPTGEIHDSVIYLVGEMLTFAAGCLGLDYFANKFKEQPKQEKKPKTTTTKPKTTTTKKKKKEDNSDGQKEDNAK